MPENVSRVRGDPRFIACKVLNPPSRSRPSAARTKRRVFLVFNLGLGILIGRRLGQSVGLARVGFETAVTLVVAFGLFGSLALPSDGALTARAFLVPMTPSVGSHAPLCMWGSTEALFDIQFWLRLFGRV